MADATESRRDLFRTGNSDGPSLIRPGMDIRWDHQGLVHPRGGGLSCFDGFGNIVTKGRVWVLTGDRPLPPGLEVVPDPPPVGHYLIGPSRSMTLDQLLTLLAQLEWGDTGRKIR